MFIPCTEDFHQYIAGQEEECYDDERIHDAVISQEKTTAEFREPYAYGIRRLRQQAELVVQPKFAECCYCLLRLCLISTYHQSFSGQRQPASKDH